MQKVLFSSVGHSATTDVLEHVFTHLQMLPKSTGDARSGDIIVRLTSDVKTLRDLLVNHVQRLGTYGLTFVSTMAVMFWMNWQLTALGLIVVPFIYVSSRYFARSIRSATKQRRKKEGAVANIVQETLSSISVVQAFAQEEAERKRFRTEARESLGASIESAKLGGAFSRTIRVLNTVGTAMVVWLGATRVLEGHMSPGDLVVFAAYIVELYTPIQNISELSVQFMESLVSGERVLELMQTAPRIVDAPHAVRAPAFRGAVQFENVVFGYGRDVVAITDQRCTTGARVVPPIGEGKYCIRTAWRFDRRRGARGSGCSRA
jgi:ATP-binding cassette subfamily B protein